MAEPGREDLPAQVFAPGEAARHAKPGRGSAGQPGREDLPAPARGEPRPKPAEWRRWLGIGLRSTHLLAVVLMGAQILGAPHPAVQWGGWLVLASGAALLASELADARVQLAELAGAVVVGKLALVALMVWQPALGPWLFWPLMAVSAVVAHAPKGVRHWRRGPGPGRRR